MPAARTKKRNPSTRKRAPAQARANGAAKKELPYLKRIGKRGAVTIWDVDGSFIRTNMDEEFSDYGHHYTFPFIPKGEFWIDQNTPEETEFFIRHMLTEYRLLEKGTDQDTARQQADAVEAELRKKAGDLDKVRGQSGLPDPEKVHERLLKNLGNGVTVWVVNGRLVRSVLDQDFTEGGHEHVYEFVPKGELWLDDQITDPERPFVILHELHERNLMEKGMDYDTAHEESSKLEKHMRHHPDELHNALADEGWEQ